MIKGAVVHFKAQYSELLLQNERLLSVNI